MHTRAVQLHALLWLLNPKPAVGKQQNPTVL
jgi:hypothetical protein